MAKKNSRTSHPGASNSAATPRLGVVMRFHPKAAGGGIKLLESGGLRVASSSDFRAAASVPNDLEGADVQYFERFGIAIVRSDQERLRPMLEKAVSLKTTASVRPERSYRALGTLHRSVGGGASGVLRSPRPIVDRDYLYGYRDGIAHLIEQLLDGSRPDRVRAAAALDESRVTWGLEATLADVSQLTGSGIKVCVLDTGFDDTHPDFLGRTITKKVFASQSSPDDIVGHGTHCIGTACGPLRPSGVPRYGIASEAQIFAGKVLGDDGFGTDRSIIAGMDWALEQGCHIVSMSLGAETAVGDQPSDDYEQIGQVCLDSGTLVIAAAGNESQRPGRISPVGSPANASTIMSVGAVDGRRNVAPFSCGGMNPGQEVDIAAPGVDVLSSIPGGGHERLDGTSMATPHVAGIAALIAQSDPKFRGWTLWARLTQLAQPLSAPGRDVGRGLVQAPRS